MSHARIIAVPCVITVAVHTKALFWIRLNHYRESAGFPICINKEFLELHFWIIVLLDCCDFGSLHFWIVTLTFELLHLLLDHCIFGSLHLLLDCGTFGLFHF